MLKSLIPAIALVSMIAAPAVSAGYHVGEGDKTSYPAAIQAAEAKVAAQNDAASGYGGVVSGSTETGRLSVSATDWNAMYNHH
jgi:hypothetical protein